MTRIETSRVKEVIGFQIASIKDAALKLNEASDLQELERDLAGVEKAIAQLKDTLGGVPFQHSTTEQGL